MVRATSACGVVENKLESRQYIFVVRTYKLDWNEGKSFLRRGQAKVLLKTEISKPQNYVYTCQKKFMESVIQFRTL